MESFASRAILDNLSEQIIVINTKNYVIVDVNRALLEALKLKRDEVVGKTCYEITHKRSTRCEAPYDTCPISEMLKTGKTITAEHTHYDANCNPFYVEVSASPIKDENGASLTPFTLQKTFLKEKDWKKSF